MNEEDRDSVQELSAGCPVPPASTEATSPAAPPFSSISPTLSYYNTIAKPIPHGHFPPLMNAYFEWSLAGIKTFYLCGASKDERLYAVHVHMGYSDKAPLGLRPGLLLHDGPSSKDTVLAATGDVSHLAARPYVFNPNSVVLLPSLDPIKNAVQATFTTETMCTSVKSGSSDDSVSFLYSIEVGNKMRREPFEWRKIREEDEVDGITSRGYKLLRLKPCSSPSSNDRSGQETLPYPDKEYEVVAVLAITKALSKSAFTHGFSLQIRGSGLSGNLGERWTLMTVVTALRVWSLTRQGRTTKTGVSIGEKIHTK